jgi:hypothetical protein
VVNVTGLGETNDGLDQNIGLLRAGGADRQLTVSSVHGVSGLESDDLLPAELVEVSAELRGSDWSSLVSCCVSVALSDLHRRSRKS